MCNTLNIKALELYCNIKKWNIELDTLIIYTVLRKSSSKQTHNKFACYFSK